jgi:hypothetical protein
MTARRLWIGYRLCTTAWTRSTRTTPSCAKPDVSRSRQRRSATRHYGYGVGLKPSLPQSLEAVVRCENQCPAPAGVQLHSGASAAELAKGWIKTPGRAGSRHPIAYPPWPRCLGLDPAAMTDTVTRRNRCCDAKDDIEFRRKLMLEPIVEKPFYAVEPSPSMQNTQGGPRRNERRRSDRTPRHRAANWAHLRLVVPGHRQHRRMPGLPPRFRAEFSGRKALVIAA